MNKEKTDLKLKESYDATAASYRQYDEVHVTGEDHLRVCGILKQCAQNHGGPVRALEIGCGAGRYFHCLSNVRQLIGIDLSEAMLEAARHPVKAEAVTAETIELRCQSVHSSSFEAESFEVIYSLGVFGNGCALDYELSGRIHDWLKQGGIFFFDAYNLHGMPWGLRVRKRLRNIVYHLASAPVRELLDQRAGWLPLFLTTQKQLKQSLMQSGFSKVDLHLSQEGRKIECLAVK